MDTFRLVEKDVYKILKKYFLKLRFMLRNNKMQYNRFSTFLINNNFDNPIYLINKEQS